MSNKIIGYLAPYDIFTNTKTPIKKGALLIKHPMSEAHYTVKLIGFTLPKEIVETWTPVVNEIAKTQEELAYEIIESVQIDRDFDSLDRNEVQNIINKLLSKYEITEKV